MSWLKLDDSFATHPKLRIVTPTVRWTHMMALCHAARHLTDGNLDAGFVRSVPAGHVIALAAAGLWDQDEAGAYRIHDYLVYNPTRDQVETERGAARERMAKFRRTFARSSASPSRPVPTGTNSHSNVKPLGTRKRAARATLTSDQTYLAERLGDLWQDVRVPLMVGYLLADFAPKVVTEALRRSWDVRPADVSNPAAYLRAACEQISKGESPEGGEEA